MGWRLRSGRYPVGELFEGESGRAIEALCVQGFEGVGESSVSLRDGRSMSFSISRSGVQRMFVVLRDPLPERLEDEAGLHVGWPALVGWRRGRARDQQSTGGHSRSSGDAAGGDARHAGGHARAPPRHCRRSQSPSRSIVQNSRCCSASDSAPVQVSLRGSIDEAIAGLGRRMGRIQVIPVDVPDDVQAYVDPEQCSLVWENCSIASNIMSSGQVLRVHGLGDEEGAFRVRLTCTAEWPSELLDELRSPYSGGAFRVDPGRGLALISWGIVQDHGGWMTAENCRVWGQPSRPTSRPRSIDADPAEREPVEDRCMGLLVVDDDVVMGETVAWMLSTLGHRATVVTTAEEGWSVLSQECFHAVLTDQRLPGMDGETLLHKIREQWPEVAERAILTSGLLHHQARRSLSPEAVQQRSNWRR